MPLKDPMETIDGLKKAYRIIWRENKKQAKP